MISLARAFPILEEGHYTFQITEVDYDETYGDMKITMETEDGKKHREQYRLLDTNGEPNEGALLAFSYMARAAMDDMTLDDIDEQELVGATFEADIEHTEATSKKGKTNTYAHVKNISPVGKTKPPQKTQKKASKGLADLL